MGLVHCIEFIAKLLYMCVDTGLSSKLLKNTLKKESCYPIVMTTARINSLNKAKVFFKKSEKPNHPVSVQGILPYLQELCIGEVNYSFQWSFSIGRTTEWFPW